MTVFDKAHVVRSNATISLKDLERIASKFGEAFPMEADVVNDLLEQYECKGFEDSQCDACETVNDEDAKFCKNCGNRFLKAKDERELSIKTFRWFGADSGRPYGQNRSDSFEKIFIKHVAPCIKGTLEVILLAQEEDDDHGLPVNPRVHGFIVQDGVYRNCFVHMTFEPTVPIV